MSDTRPPNAIEIGRIITIGIESEDKPTIYPMAMVLQFFDKEDLRKALQTGEVRFTVLS